MNEIPFTPTINKIKNEKFKLFITPIKIKIENLHATKNFISIYSNNQIIIYEYKIKNKMEIKKYRIINNHLILFVFTRVNENIKILLLNILNSLCERKVENLYFNLEKIILKICCKDILEYKVEKDNLIIIDKYDKKHFFSVFGNFEKIEMVNFKIVNDELRIYYSNRSFFERVKLKQNIKSFFVVDEKVFVSGEDNLILMVFEK